MGHSAVAGDKDHIERQIGVFHPHIHGLLGLEIEQHAPVGGHKAAIHQPFGPLFIRAHHLNREVVLPAGGRDLEGLQYRGSPCPLCRGRREAREHDQSKKRKG